jgi:hypothetical protein
MPSRPNVFVLAHGDRCQTVLTDRVRADLDVFDPDESLGGAITAEQLSWMA